MATPASAWHADRWLRSDRLPPDVIAPFHLDFPCQGIEKVRNGLFTLQRLVGQSFCLAFDQLEDTYLTLGQPGSGEATQFAALVGILVRNLLTMPGFCLLFACQESVWSNFVQPAPPMLVQRMTEGYGAQPLRPLEDDAVAQELVRDAWLRPFSAPSWPRARRRPASRAFLSRPQRSARCESTREEGFETSCNGPSRSSTGNCGHPGTDRHSGFLS